MLPTATLRARQIRESAVLFLGGKCKTCPSRTDLQFHLLFDDGGAHHKFGSIKRAQFYFACAKLGDCELLCRTCHARAHARLRAALKASVVSESKKKEEQPQGQGCASGFSDSI